MFDVVQEGNKFVVENRITGEIYSDSLTSELAAWRLCGELNRSITPTNKGNKTNETDSTEENCSSISTSDCKQQSAATTDSTYEGLSIPQSSADASELQTEREKHIADALKRADAYREKLARESGLRAERIRESRERQSESRERRREIREAIKLIDNYMLHGTVPTGYLEGDTGCVDVDAERLD